MALFNQQEQKKQDELQENDRLANVVYNQQKEGYTKFWEEEKKKWSKDPQIFNDIIESRLKSDQSELELAQQKKNHSFYQDQGSIDRTIALYQARVDVIREFQER